MYEMEYETAKNYNSIGMHIALTVMLNNLLL
jgi:hypothetical protein